MASMNPPPLPPPPSAYISASLPNFHPPRDAFDSNIMPGNQHLLGNERDRKPLLQIHHPGYEKSIPLFMIAGLDDEEGGINLSLVLNICEVLSGNEPDGFLSKSKQYAPATAISSNNPNALLKAGTYYYHLGMH
jgi:hypothetical protein